MRPNRSHWNALLLAYAEAGDGAGCAACYRSMVSSAIQPDACTLTALLRAAYLLAAGLPAVQAVRAEAGKHRVPMNLRMGTAMLACLRHVSPAGSPGAAALRQLRPAKVARRDRRRQRRRQTCEHDGGGAVAAAEVHHQQAAAGVGARAADASAAADVGAAVLSASPAGMGAQERASADGQDQSAQCLAGATALFAELRAAAAAGGSPLDVRAYNALLAVQLAAGDHAGVLHTFQQLEDGEHGLLPDASTLAAVIAACQQAGWKEEEAQYRQLLKSSQLLGTLGGRLACRGSISDGSA